MPKKKKFDWTKLSSAEKDSVMTKVVRPYLDSNWNKMGWIKRGAASTALGIAGKYKESLERKKKKKSKP